MTKTETVKPKATTPANPAIGATIAPKRVTKKAQLIKLLGTKAGAGVAAISAKFGWQQHTTRAALSGLKKAGLTVTVEKSGAGKPSRYRIAAEPAPTPTAAAVSTQVGDAHGA